MGRGRAISLNEDNLVVEKGIQLRWLLPIILVAITTGWFARDFSIQDFLIVGQPLPIQEAQAAVTFEAEEVAPIAAPVAQQLVEIAAPDAISGADRLLVREQDTAMHSLEKEEEALVNDDDEETPEAHQEAAPSKPLAKNNSCEPESTWVVESGWSLSRIAELCWGNASYWPHLYDANSLVDSRITNPHIIHEGDVLVIPGLPPDLAERIAQQTEQKKAAKHRPKQRRAAVEKETPVEDLGQYKPAEPDLKDLVNTVEVDDLSRYPDGT